MIVFGNPLPYDIRITGSANMGFILNCGCCTCTFSDKKEMLKAIEDYIDHPEDMEKKYHDSRKNDRPQEVHGNTLAMGRGTGPRRTEPMNEAKEDCGCQQEDTGPDERARR